MNLQLLNDADLSGLTSWLTPLARMDNRAVADWAETAWHAVTDEQSRREGGAPAVTPWPDPDALPTEAVVLIGQLLAGLHDAGSDYLRAWVEEAGEQLVDELCIRAEGWASGAS